MHLYRWVRGGPGGGMHQDRRVRPLPVRGEGRVWREGHHDQSQLWEARLQKIRAGDYHVLSCIYCFDII